LLSSFVTTLKTAAAHPAEVGCEEAAAARNLDLVKATLGKKKIEVTLQKGPEISNKHFFDISHLK
jgi:hypothetical protein